MKSNKKYIILAILIPILVLTSVMLIPADTFLPQTTTNNPPTQQTFSFSAIEGAIVFFNTRQEPFLIGECTPEVNILDNIGYLTNVEGEVYANFSAEIGCDPNVYFKAFEGLVVPAISRLQTLEGTATFNLEETGKKYEISAYTYITSLPPSD